MASSYTSLLGFVLPLAGDLVNTWGDTVNNQLTQLAEDAIAGVATHDVTGGDWTLSYNPANGLTDEHRKAILIATGTPNITRNIISQNTSKAYIVINNSNSAVVVKAAATTGVTIPTGSTALIAWSGTDYVLVSIPVTSASTGAVQVPSGSGAQRPTPVAGQIRFNTDNSKYEGYNGTTWASIGGGATGGGSDAVFVENGQTVTTNYTITTGNNAMSAGPITISTGITITINAPSVWTIV